MKAQSPHLLIFSVFQENKPLEQNMLAHSVTQKSLVAGDVPHIPIHGSFRAKKELGFIVPAEHRALVESLCYQHKQECYLEHHKDRYCELVFTDFKVPLGTMRETTKEKAEKSECYTITPDGRYFVTER